MKSLKRLEKGLKKISLNFEVIGRGNNVFLYYTFSEEGKKRKDVVSGYRYSPTCSRKIFHDAYRWLRLLKRFKLREFSPRR